MKEFGSTRPVRPWGGNFTGFLLLLPYAKCFAILLGLERHTYASEGRRGPTPSNATKSWRPSLRILGSRKALRSHWHGGNGWGLLN